MSSIGQEYYPETLGTMFIINAPFLFSSIWSGIKIFIDKRTQEKIQILGSNYKNEMLKYVDEENIPNFFGGRADSDLERNFGPWNPDGLEIFGLKKDI